MNALVGSLARDQIDSMCSSAAATRRARLARDARRRQRSAARTHRRAQRRGTGPLSRLG